jgi:hypothetical protein
MHRHVLHQVVAVSQNRMQMSLSIRRNAEKVWKVRNRAADKLAFGVTFGHLKLRAIGYELWSTDAEALPPHHEQHRPMESYTWWSGAPWNQWIFRMYNSFTGASSPRVLLREMKTVRVQNGLHEDGTTRREQRAMELLKKKRAGKAARVFRVLRRASLRFVRFAVVVSLAFGAGRLFSRGSPGETDIAATGAGVEPVPESFGVLQAVASDFVRIEGKRYAIGQRVGPGSLVMCEPGARRAFVRGDDGVFWMWARGGEPRRMGTIDDLRARAIAGGIHVGGAEPGPPDDPIGVAEPSEGDVQRGVAAVPVGGG